MRADHTEFDANTETLLYRVAGLIPYLRHPGLTRVIDVLGGLHTYFQVVEPFCAAVHDDLIVRREPVDFQHDSSAS